MQLAIVVVEFFPLFLLNMFVLKAFPSSLSLCIICTVSNVLLTCVNKNLTRDDSQTLSILSNSQRVSHFAALRHNLSCGDSDRINTSGSIVGSTWKQIGSLDHNRKTCLVHHAQQQIWPHSNTWRAAQNRETNNKATRRGRLPSANGKEQPQQTCRKKTWLHFSLCTCYPNTLSRHCHITQ